MQRLALPVLLSITLAACASSQPAKTDSAALKFDYHTQHNAPQTGKSVAMVTLVCVTNDASPTEKSFVDTLPIKLASRALQFSAVSRYRENYETPFQNAMQSALEEMIVKRGFSAKGPYQSVEAIPYSDKKRLYLAVVPKLYLNIEQRSTSHSCIQKICTDTGVITLSGDFLLRFVDPLTEQTARTKQIDLHGFGIKKNYVHQYPQETHTAVRQGLLYTDKASTSLIDDADKELADAINEFYAASLAKIDNLISAEDLLASPHAVTQDKE
jgi:hypothetical protein